MGKRRRSRELAVQVLFQLGFIQGDPNDTFDLICKNFNAKKSVRPFSHQLVLGVCEKKNELDRLISQTSKNWRLKRISRIDKCILRIAIFEILFMDDIPPKVSIDEAVEIGKKFGTEDSGSFINGILDNIYNTLAKENEERIHN